MKKQPDYHLDNLSLIRLHTKLAFLMTVPEKDPSNLQKRKKIYAKKKEPFQIYTLIIPLSQFIKVTPKCLEYLGNDPS